MPLRRLGISNYRLFWSRQIQAVADNEAALKLLTQFKDDLGAMRDLRALLAESNNGMPNARPTGDQVLVGIARLLASGELMLVREGPMHGGSATQPGTSSQPAAPPASAPATASKSQAPENPSLPPDTDGASQAAVLAAAASSGAPFCAH